MPGLTFSNELISRDEVCSNACYFDESAPSSVNFEKVVKIFHGLNDTRLEFVKLKISGTVSHPEKF